MKTQISKHSHKPGKRYNGVFQQQGRMITDADWNELVDTLRLRLDDALKDVIDDGAPRERGLAIDTVDGEIVIRSGHLYVDGIKAEVPGGGATVHFDGQEDFPASPLPDDDAVVYADVWEKTVVSLEDSDLRDPGLHGADTCSRSQTLAQIKTCPASMDPETDTALNPTIGSARVDVRLWEESDADSEGADPCITEVAENPRVGNYLFRVEVHDFSVAHVGSVVNATLTLKWSEENGAEHHGLVSRDESGAEQHGYATVPAEFGAENWVYEFYTDTSERHLGHQLNSSFTPARGEIRGSLDRNANLPAIGGETAHYVRRWDGYCVIALSSSAPGSAWIPDSGQLSGEDKNQPLQTAQAPGHGNVTFSQDGDNYRMTIYLEKLILTLELDNHDFLAGDYWLAEVREDAPYFKDADPVIDQRVNTLNDGATLGIRHHYIKLADIVGGVIETYAPGSSQERRMSFPPLTDITADRIRYEPGATLDRWGDINEAGSTAPNTVQKAIDDLVDNLESSDIKYVLPDCPITDYGAHTLKALIQEKIENTFAENGHTKAKIEDVWNAMLCHLDAAKLPYDPTQKQDRWQDLKEGYAPTPTWAKRYGGAGEQYPRGLTVDSGGNIVLVGAFEGSINFGDTGDVLTSQGQNDIYLVKLDADGEHLWSHQFGDASSQYGQSVTTDSEDNIVVMGVFSGTLRFDGSDEWHSEGDTDDLFIAKFTADGSYLWSKHFPGNAQDAGYALVSDSQGNLVLTGFFEDEINFGTAGDELSSAGNYDIFLAKLDADGQHVWSFHYGSTGFDIAYGLAVDGQDNIALTGSFEETVNFGGDALQSSGKADIFVAKFDPTGHHLWSKNFGGARSDYARTVAFDPRGDLILSGEYQDTINFGGTGDELTASGGYDIFVAKLSSEGGHLWSIGIGGGAADQGHALAIDPTGYVLLTGNFGGTVTVGDRELVSLGMNDIFVVSFAPDGSHAFAVAYGGADETFGRNIGIDQQGDLILGGFFRGSVSFGEDTLVSAGAGDVFLAKLFLPKVRPTTVQAAIDHLITNLDSSDIPYEIPACGTEENPTVRSGLSLIPGLPSKVDTVLNHLLCDFNADDLPLDKSGVIADLLNVDNIKTTQNALNFLAERISGQGCALTVGAGGQFETLEEAFAGLSEVESIALCLLPGMHDLVAGIDVTGKRSIKLTGAGSKGSVLRTNLPIALSAEEIMLSELALEASNDAQLVLEAGRVTAKGCAFTRSAPWQPHLWSKSFGGVFFDSGRSAAIDADGNVLLTGYFQGTANFGGSDLESAGNFDIYLVKLASGGEYLWSQRFGGTSADYSMSLAVDESDNVLLTGYFRDTVNFGGDDLVSAGDDDIYLAKLARDGAHQWSRRFGGASGDSGTSMALDASGNILLCGTFRDSVNFGGDDLVSAGGVDIFLAKFSPDGSHLWSRRFGSTTNDRSSGVAVDAAGNVLLTGYFSRTINFGGDDLVASTGGSDIYLAKFAPDGGHLWSRGFGGTDTDAATSVAVDTFGNVLLTGYFSGTVNFGGDNLVSASRYRDVCLAKFAPDGGHLWSQSFGGTSHDYGRSVAVDTLGNVLCTGYFQGTVNFGGEDLSSAGGYDIYLVKLAADGAHLWSRRFGDTSADYGHSVAVDSHGNMVLTGGFYNTVNFGGDDLTSAGGADIYVAKFGPMPPPEPPALLSIQPPEADGELSLCFSCNIITDTIDEDTGHSGSGFAMRLATPNIGGWITDNQITGRIALLDDLPLEITAPLHVDSDGVDSIGHFAELLIRGNALTQISSHYDSSNSNLDAYGALVISDNTFRRGDNSCIARTISFANNHFKNSSSNLGTLVANMATINGNQALRIEDELTVIMLSDYREAANLLTIEESHFDYPPPDH